MTWGQFYSDLLEGFVQRVVVFKYEDNSSSNKNKGVKLRYVESKIYMNNQTWTDNSLTRTEIFIKYFLLNR